MRITRTNAGLSAAGTAILALGFISGAFAAPLFRDVPPTHWAYNSVTWASTNGIMNGPGDMPGYFDPAGVANRAQLATVLARYDQLVQSRLDAL